MSNWRFTPPSYPTLKEAFKRGYDCGINGANHWNCSYLVFSTPEHAIEWEKGKKKAEKEKIITNAK